MTPGDQHGLDGERVKIAHGEREEDVEDKEEREPGRMKEVVVVKKTRRTGETGRQRQVKVGSLLQGKFGPRLIS